MTSQGKIPDEALLRLIARGDETALGDLYDRYNALIYSLAMNVLGDASTAEEVALDTFTQAWSKAATYQPRRASVKTWLTTIARNRAIDAARYKRIRLDQHTPRWTEADLDSIPNPVGPEEEFNQRSVQKLVQRAISELPDDQKEVLALAYYRGYPHSQIAKIVNKPLGTVKTHIRNAMQQLRKTLNET
jgi:RNA polymerase sigma-70 factor (ECF subfamily)